MRISHTSGAWLALALVAGVTMTTRDVNAQAPDEDVLLLQIGGAAENGEVERFDSTLAQWRAAKRFSLAALDRNGVLHAAARGTTKSHTAIVERLLALGLDPNAPSGLPRYPLHLAAAVGNLDTVEVLLGHDARIGVVDEDNQSVLHAAVEGNGDQALAIVKRLLALRADLDARNIWGQTPLHWAAWHGAEMIPILIEAGAPLEATDREGRTPLLVAHGQGVAALLAAGANLRAIDAKGNTAVHWAATKGADGVLRLLDAGLGADARNAAGLSPLHFAIIEGGSAAPAVIDLLAKRGADANAQTTADYAYLSPWMNPRANQPQLVRAGITPLALARARHKETRWSSGGYPAIIEVLERHGAKATGTRKAQLSDSNTGARRLLYRALLLPLNLCAIALFGVGLLYADARMTGWSAIAARHAAPTVLDGQSFERRDVDVGTVGLVRIRNLMRAAALDEGLYLAMPTVLGIGHPPLLVPWTEVQITRETQVLGRNVVKLSVGSPKLGEITLRGAIADEARQRLRRQ